ncbi:aromatic amino acid transport family protein [Iodobacter sp. CM08]|uniref:amino acid permease n=1 Tax=Iodobacter sp. CM08 TaxID=3085902 RepID=UPI0029821249|nr:aromatic amino acid transport family protein [Iodobacter sp. CM08]MDW5415078.1 aromatic amino acid transport family protein [Iodobacter sp. CM08]
MFAINFKAVGATLLISGTMLGAGMLALPLVSSGMGYTYASLALVCIWLLMTYTALMLLEVSLAFPEGSGFDVMAQSLFGNKGLWIINASLLLLLYALSGAYISGAASSYTSNIKQYLGINIPSAVVAAIFTLLIGSIVYMSTGAVDRVNRVLFSLNVFIFFAMAITIQPYVNQGNLNNTQDSSRYIYAAFPVFITAFGFHGSIPSMVKYIGRDKPQTLRNIFILGGLIPLLVYGIWEYCSLGLVPRMGENSFLTLAENQGSVGMFLDFIHASTSNRWIPSLISLFSSIALFTSYLCVSLGLFDSVASSVGWKDSKHDRLITALATYLPPFVFAWIYPEGFVLALGAAAIFLSILAILFPALALYKLRSQATYRTDWRVPGNTCSFCTVTTMGLCIIVFQIMKMQNLLPIC